MKKYRPYAGECRWIFLLALTGLSLMSAGLQNASAQDQKSVFSESEFAELRAAHPTKLKELKPAADAPAKSEPAKPPAEIFKLIKFKGALGEYSGYLTPGAEGVVAEKNEATKAGADNAKVELKPLIIWLHGGNQGIGSWLWEDYVYARLFIDAGFHVFCPSRRGEHKNPGQVEHCRGEVDDTLSALSYARELKGVNKDRIYLLGFDEGGTIALLTSALTSDIRATAAVGPGLTLKKEMQESWDFNADDSMEFYLRSPVHFLHQTKSPTFLFFGEAAFAEQTLIDSLKTVLSNIKNNQVRVFQSSDSGQFELLSPCLQLLAEKLKNDVKKDSTAALAITKAELESQVDSYQKLVKETRRARREATDLRILANLKASMSDFSQVHDLTYYIVSRSKASLANVNGPATAAGFKCDPIEQQRTEAGEEYFLLRLKIQSKLDMARIFSLSEKVSGWSEQFELQYENWSSQAVTQPAAPK